MATRDGGMVLYALAARNEFAPGFDQLGTVQAISAQTAATEWLHERHDRPAVDFNVVDAPQVARQ